MPSETLEEFKTFYKIHPKKEKGTSNQLYYDECPNVNKQTVKSWVFRLQRVVQPVEIKKIKKNQSHNSSNNDTKKLAHIIESVENPVAFASAHIFKKMIETGDVRWAQLFVSVLDKTNKLDYETSREQEWLKQASNMSMDDLVSKIAVKGSISKNILRRLEEADDTSLYDNL